ncbi:hypothetical protein [Altererythrobacter fulvus]|uniref:hypothetical protein n=1 Tax=Caenibius fulvus TaxID=2126012 RepID=UPI00301A5E23
MVRRSTPRDILDDRAFPVRVLIADNYRVGGPGLRITEAQAWAGEHIGHGNFACHGQSRIGVIGYGFYFRTVEDAVRFLDAHPHLELADTTHRVQHLMQQRNPPRRPVGWQTFSPPGPLSKDFKP